MKLLKKHVLHISLLIEQCKTNREIKSITSYNISNNTLNQIRNRTIYKNHTKDYHFPLDGSRIPIGEVHKICKLLSLNLSDYEVSYVTNTSLYFVKQIRNKYIHREVTEMYNYNWKPSSLKEMIKFIKQRIKFGASDKQIAFEIEQSITFVEKARHQLNNTQFQLELIDTSDNSEIYRTLTINSKEQINYCLNCDSMTPLDRISSNEFECDNCGQTYRIK